MFSVVLIGQVDLAENGNENERGNETKTEKVVNHTSGNSTCTTYKGGCSHIGNSNTAIVASYTVNQTSCSNH